MCYLWVEILWTVWARLCIFGIDKLLVTLIDSRVKKTKLVTSSQISDRFEPEWLYHRFHSKLVLTYFGWCLVNCITSVVNVFVWKFIPLLERRPLVSFHFDSYLFIHFLLSFVMVSLNIRRGGWGTWRRICYSRLYREDGSTHKVENLGKQNSILYLQIPSMESFPSQLVLKLQASKPNSADCLHVPHSGVPEDMRGSPGDTG